jgi:hypothetical protein
LPAARPDVPPGAPLAVRPPAGGEPGAFSQPLPSAQ